MPKTTMGTDREETIYDTKKLKKMAPLNVVVSLIPQTRRFQK